MIKLYDDPLKLEWVDAATPTVRIELPRSETRQALDRLLSAAPDLCNAADGDVEIAHAPDALILRASGEIDPETAIALIQHRIHLAALWLTSIDDQLQLRELQRSGCSAYIRFDIDMLGDSIPEAVRMLKLPRRHTLTGAQYALQLHTVFRVDTVGQLVCWLARVLDPSQQVVTSTHRRASMRAFWDWADANAIYLTMEILQRRKVRLSDMAFFLMLTKLHTRLTDAADVHLRDVDGHGRVRLPLAQSPAPSIIPDAWLTRMQTRATRIERRHGVRLINDRTDPPIYSYALRHDTRATS
jgi:hypothetical protein